MILPKEPSSSNLTHIHRFFKRKQIILTGGILDAVGKTQIILVFSHTEASMEVKPRVEFILYKENDMCVSSPGLRLVVLTFVNLGKVVIFSV